MAEDAPDVRAIFEGFGRDPDHPTTGEDVPVRLATSLAADDDLLSERELQVLKCYSHGAGALEAGEILGIDYETVRVCRRNAMRKLKAKTVSHAIANALRARLIP